jgi:hypothetical protein
MGVLDGVSLLLVGSGVKRKAHDGCRGWSGREGCAASRLVTATVVMLGYWTLTRRLEVMSCTANTARILRSRMPARLYSCETLLGEESHDHHDERTLQRHSGYDDRQVHDHGAVRPATPWRWVVTSTGQEHGGRGEAARVARHAGPCHAGFPAPGGGVYDRNRHPSRAAET